MTTWERSTFLALLDEGGEVRDNVAEFAFYF